MVLYYEEFMNVERQDIKFEIEEVKKLITIENDIKNGQIAQLEKEKNERMEKMRKEMLLEVK